MSLFLKFNKKLIYSSNFDYYSYLAYRYHHLFFRSLIFRGRKLWAFNFFIILKMELKKREQIDPFWIILISLLKITPEFLLFPLKLGGVVQWVPLHIPERKQYTFSVKFVIKLIRDKQRIIKLGVVADALIFAIYGRGIAMEKKLSLYNIALLNRHLVTFFK